MIRCRVIASLACGLMFSAAMPAAAQNSWPDRPIRVLVPSGPGGTSDIFMRLLGEYVGKTLGQPVVVVNRPGAGGTVAATAVAQAEPDGYTLMMNSVATHGIAPSMYTLSFDPDKDVTAVAQLAYTANILYVRKGSPYQSVGQLIDEARKNPGKLNYASSGSGTSLHLAGVEFARASDVQTMHIPYNGAAPAMQAVLAGEVAFSIENAMALMGQIRNDAVTPLAVTTRTRISQLPDVPTVREAGGPEIDMSSWFGIVAPGGTPGPVVDKLAQAFESAVKDPKIVEQIGRLGADPQFLPAVEFSAYMKSEREKWASIVKASGAKVN